MAAHIVDISGRRFGHVVALRRVSSTRTRQSVWLCRCECGKEFETLYTNLVRCSPERSCGCLRASCQSKRATKHGQWKSPRWIMWMCAKSRARKKHLPCSITFNDMPEIPETCPILGFPLEQHHGVGGMKFNSPTLDRIIPSLGYVPGNIQIISQRANVIKNDASAEEVRKVATYLEGLCL